MSEFLVFTVGVAMMVGGYRMATTGYDITRRPPLFYYGWACTILGGTAAACALYAYLI